jgi:hypothetical protein
MYQTIDFNDFAYAFFNYGRADQFTPDGLCVLFDYLAELEYSTDTPIELDVIGLCCDYNEGTFAELAAQYGITLDPDDVDGLDATDLAATLKEAVLDYLSNQTIVCGDTDNTIVYVVF